MCLFFIILWLHKTIRVNLLLVYCMIIMKSWFVGQFHFEIFYSSIINMILIKITVICNLKSYNAFIFRINSLYSKYHNMIMSSLLNPKNKSASPSNSCNEYDARLCDSIGKKSKHSCFTIEEYIAKIVKQTYTFTSWISCSAKNYNSIIYYQKNIFSRHMTLFNQNLRKKLFILFVLLSIVASPHLSYHGICIPFYLLH